MSQASNEQAITMEQEQILSLFCLNGTPVSCTPLGTGHINETYLVRCDADGVFTDYVLQRLNTEVFQKPLEVMENIVRVTAWIRKQLEEAGEDPRRGTLTFLPAKDGRFCVLIGNKCWRVCEYIADAAAYEQTEDVRFLRESAYAFGRFQLMLRDFPARELHETIVDFHNTPKRYAAFLEAVRRDLSGRQEQAAEEIRFLKDHEDLSSILSKAYEEGRLPLRVTHNDTKLSNVMMDPQTGKAVCEIDLDTVMPGFSVTDFGDAIRTGASTAAEDEPDLSKVHFDLQRYLYYVEGFAAGTGGGLTQAEYDLLPYGALVITYEQALRFLTDFLDGDLYYKTDYPDHNLVRARTQIRMVAEMLEHLEEMKIGPASAGNTAADHR